MAKSAKSVDARAKEMLAFAKKSRKQIDEWPAFHNALYGIGGKCIELFPEKSDRIAYLQTDEHKQILEMLAELQGKSKDKTFTETLANANGSISVRCPKSIHAALIKEAEAEGVSLNQLCVAKLSTQLAALV